MHNEIFHNALCEEIQVNNVECDTSEPQPSTEEHFDAAIKPMPAVTFSGMFDITNVRDTKAKVT